MSEIEIFLGDAMDACGDAVYRLALCHLQNEADAEDVFQDVFLLLLKEKDARHWDPGHLKAWLLRVAINRCHNTARSRRRRQTLSLDEVPELTSAPTEGDNELWEALGRLPVKYRDVVVLHYVEGYKTEEIARLMECSDSTVRSRLYRGRQKLKEMMGGILYEEPLQKDDGADQNARCIEE